MESLVGGIIPSDAYMLEENTALLEELQLLQARADRNPEVTRFALENIRLLDKLRKFQDFYEEGEREMLLTEVSELRDQLLQFLNGNREHQNHLNVDVPFQLKEAHKELEDCRNNLSSCLEANAKLTREINDLHSELDNLKSACYDHEADIKPVMKAPEDFKAFESNLFEAIEKEKSKWKHEISMKHIEEIMNLQLELDIIKVIVQEERSSCGEVENRALSLSTELQIAKERCLQISMQFEDAENKLKDANSVIEALESQQILLINELDGIKDSNNSYMELLSKQNQDIFVLREQLCSQELRKSPSLEQLDSEDTPFPLQAKLKRMHDSLEKAKRLNMWYKSDQAFQTSHEEEMNEVRREVEAETAQVIVCLQEELASLQQQVMNCSVKETETQENLLLLETKSKDLQEKLQVTTQDKEKLSALFEEKDEELRTLSEEWEKLACEIEEVIEDGHDAINDVSGQVNSIASSLPQRTWIQEQVGRMLRNISEKELMIEELQRCLEEAQNTRVDMEWKLESLRGATLVMTEVQEQKSSEKERESLLLAKQLDEKTNWITKLEDRIKIREKQIRRAETCATVAFIIVNRLNEVNSNCRDALKHKEIQINDATELNAKKDALLQDQVAITEETEKQIKALKNKLGCSEKNCHELQVKLSEVEEHTRLMERKLTAVEEDVLLKTREELDEFKLGVSTLSSCMNEYTEKAGGVDIIQKPGKSDDLSVNNDSKEQTVIESGQNINKKYPPSVGDLTNDIAKSSFRIAQNVNSCEQEDFSDRDQTIFLLRREIESALKSLQAVQAQMAQLREEKEEIKNSEKQSQKNLECVTSQLLTLQAEISSSEKLSELRLMELDHKIRELEEMAREASAYQCQKQEVLDHELNDAKMLAVQKNAEAASLLAKYEEAQGTIKEADVMVNALMAANDRAKLEIERLKRVEVGLMGETDCLFNEVQSMKASNDQKDQQYDNLEKQYSSDLSGARSLVLSLEDIVTHVQAIFKEEYELMLCDFQCLKNQLLDSANLTRSWLESIWSEIIVKDCAVSVLHLCHMGVLLEAVNGLNAENGLLHHGLCESSSVIENLKQHNSKAKKELEMCSVLKGKLLVDIKNSFDRISKKEDESGKLSTRLTSFEKKIYDLQLQEELMLARSNSMGSELSLLVKELNLSNTDALKTLLDQEQLLKNKQEIMDAQIEFITIDLTAKDFESFILASELTNMALQKAYLERQQEKLSDYLNSVKQEFVILKVEAELDNQLFIDLESEVALLKGVVDKSDEDRNNLLQKLEQCSLRLSEVQQSKVDLERDIHSLNQVSHLNDQLKDELGESKKSKERLKTQIQELEAENERLIKDWERKETALVASVCKLQMELSWKDEEVNKTSSIEEENKALKNEVTEMKTDKCRAVDELQEKNEMLQDKICSLETCIVSIQTDCDMMNEEMEELRHSQSITAENLVTKERDLEIQVNMMNSLNKEKFLLRDELTSVEKKHKALISILSLNFKSFVNSIEAVNMIENRVFKLLDANNVMLLDKMFHDICEDKERACNLILECECLESFTEELISENLSFQAELSRKDEVLKGLLFDLSLLQESASNAKDQKDELEEMMATIESLEDDLIQKSSELEEAVAHGQVLEDQLEEKIDLVSTLELDVSKARDSLKLVMDENVGLVSQMKDSFVAKSSLEEELTEKSKVIERLEDEIFQVDNALGQTNIYIEGLKKNLNEVIDERDHLDTEILVLREKLEMAQTQAEETEAIAVEAQQVAELRKTYAEEKEEEVKLLERSVEELERTVDVLENKVDIIKGEAEKQRLQREELEIELQAIRNQMLRTPSGTTKDTGKENLRCAEELQSKLEERERDLQEAHKQIQILETNITEKDAQISQCRVYISELNVHAEAQARDYKQKFKQLEAMAEQVKPDPLSSHAANLSNSPSTKTEKIASKPRGSGSPFKCIGLGLAQQISSEKDEELKAGRHRIEELEALAASRQKEIFMLNARLAAAESMTHDVIRDLLGVKLDMTNYASLLDHQQVHKITEKARLQSEDSLVKDQEVLKLRQQLNQFIEERQGWLEEINRRHAEMVAAQIAAEKLQQRDQFLSTENEMLKKDNVSQKKKLMELEDEVKKLSGQQNLQQRIHHHAKIKEENNHLKTQNEDLSAKLRRTEAILTRLKEELARYRASNGRNPFIDFDQEHRLNNKLKETEEERLQLAQKLLSLCTSILKAAGITRSISDVSPSIAEEALNQLKDRVVSLEREVQDLTFKNRVSNERARLSELKQQSSPLSSRREENCTTPGGKSQTPFLTTLSR